MYIPARMQNCLLPFTLLYRTGAAVHNRLYTCGILRSKKAPLPVISVGNISFGGSEKTPLAAALIERFLTWGRRPALVTRGYRGRWEKTGGIVSDGRTILSDWRNAGDEPYMLARNYPRAGVFVGRDRLEGCRKAAELGFDIAILDDGFQHRRLIRDMDIVLYHAGDKVMRREFQSALDRSHVILVRKENTESIRRSLLRRRRLPPVIEYEVKFGGFFSVRNDRPVDPHPLCAQRILAISGIARPGRFLASLQALGINPTARLDFPDHHDYPTASLARISVSAESHRCQAILTTEKDAVKLRGRLDPEGIPVYFLKIELDLPPEFDALLEPFRNPMEQMSA